MRGSFVGMKGLKRIRWRMATPCGVRLVTRLDPLTTQIIGDIPPYCNPGPAVLPSRS